MNKIAFVVEILESKKDLFSDDFDECARNAFALVPLDEGEEMLSERLENYADMGRLGSLVSKGVEKRDDMLASGMERRDGGDARQQFNLIPSGFGITACGLDDLEGSMTVQSGGDRSERVGAESRE